MAWGDGLGGLGGGAGGMSKAYQFEQERQSREKIAAQQAELREMLGRISAGSREKVAEIGADAKRDVADRQAKGRLAVQELANNGDLQVAKTQGDWHTQVAKMQADNLITIEEMQALNRMNIAEVNRAIQAAHDAAGQKRTETEVKGRQDVANTNLEGTKYTADQRATSAANTEQGINDRFAQQNALDRYKAETNIMFPRSQAGRRGAAKPPTISQWQGQNAMAGLPASPFRPSDSMVAAGGGET